MTKYKFNNCLGCRIINFILHNDNCIRELFFLEAIDCIELIDILRCSFFRCFQIMMGQTTINKISISWFSANHTRHSGETTKTAWPRIRIMCQNGATCLHSDCCFSELALTKSRSASWSITKRT